MKLSGLELQMKKIGLTSGDTLIIRKAIKEDAINILEYIEKVAIESDNISFGPGEFGISPEQERNNINSLKESKNCIFILGLIKNEIVSIAS